MVQILIPENFNLGLFWSFSYNQYISDGLSWAGLHNSLMIDD